VDAVNYGIDRFSVLGYSSGMNQIFEGGAFIILVMVPLLIVAGVLYQHWRGKETDDKITRQVKDSRAFGKAFMVVVVSVAVIFAARYYFTNHPLSGQ
jgi:phosphoglycerol transferase MdoB-like AlkP superfamily enzyme